MTAAGLAALLCVAAMGLAIQRGATCTVAAVDELLNQRRATRLAALLEAALWVGGGLALAQLAGLERSMPAGYPVSVWTVIGGMLLGLGAWINRACVFGAIARLGSGDWAYAATPLGYFIGCLSAMPLFARPAPGPLAEPSPLFRIALGFALGFAVFALWRVRPGLLVLRGPHRVAAWRQQLAAPHAATVVIGICFVAVLLLAGRWAYTDVLADLAQAMRGRAVDLSLPLLLLLALYVGALVGGHRAGTWRPTPPTAAALLRCTVGGIVMAWGSLLIPGSNDGLILIGLPLLRPYALLAFATMLVTIALAMRLDRLRRGEGG